MSRPAIVIEALSKAYRIGLEAKRLPTFREALVELAQAPLRRIRGLREPGTGRDTFWALQNVSFEVAHGEVVGIIGCNGAGKSTLLKVLARITEPTSGQARIRGRVASLLEVGTGFHPELTGRENVYLNGSILGMRKAEIDRKFDEIVAFSGVERFLDTPVKRYSSGMYVRLAFAVAAHLEPEILIVDEVLAVGDMEFQKKCLGKMDEVARGGRTVLFVSHNMAAVQNLCRRGVLLAGGRVVTSGSVEQVIETYLHSGQVGDGSRLPLSSFRAAKMTPVIQEVEVADANGRPTTTVLSGAPLTVTIRYDSPIPLHDPRFGLFFETMTGERLFSLHSLFQHGRIGSLPQRGEIVCRAPALPLIPGSYRLTITCGMSGRAVDKLDRAVELSVVAADYFKTGRLPPPHHGRCLVNAAWTLPDEAEVNGVGVVDDGLSDVY